MNRSKNEEDIANNPSFRKLREDAENLSSLAKVWPLLKPLARLVGVDAGQVDGALGRVDELTEDIERMTSLPDRFNGMFAESGWILFDSMEPDAAERAIAIAETEGLEKAEEFLVQHFSPSWVESRINWLRHIKGFRERFAMARKALEDYKAERYYASVLVVLTLIDGWVNELNLVGSQRNDFFSADSRLVAWDSIAAHPKGLVRLQEVFGKSRQKTRTEEIRVPYRHGIIHGMDLGYSNEYVAAKCWAALFAVRDWAIKVAKDELEPPELEPEVEKTLWESIESYQRTREEIEEIRRWQPRSVTVGENIPAAGQIEDYEVNTPERITVEFLHHWRERNYGYLAERYAQMLQMTPGEARERHQHQQLLDFALVEVEDVSPVVSDVTARLTLEINDKATKKLYQFRLVANTKESELAHLASDKTAWGVTTWRRV